jgi:hypothetical protein
VQGCSTHSEGTSLTTTLKPFVGITVAVGIGVLCCAVGVCCELHTCSSRVLRNRVAAADIGAASVLAWVLLSAAAYVCEPADLSCSAKLALHQISSAGECVLLVLAPTWLLCFRPPLDPRLSPLGVLRCVRTADVGGMCRSQTIHCVSLRTAL